MATTGCYPTPASGIPFLQGLTKRPPNGIVVVTKNATSSARHTQGGSPSKLPIASLVSRVQL
jgi:hypothetical protein